MGEGNKGIKNPEGIKHDEPKDDMSDRILDLMIDLERDPDRRNGIRIMRELHTTTHNIYELRYFADQNKRTVPAKDRIEVLELLEHINERLSEFWADHKKPEGTMWDEE